MLENVKIFFVAK